MAKKILLIGLSHHTAPVDIRERLAFKPSQLQSALEAGIPDIYESVVLSTCNRLEIYTAVDNLQTTTTTVVDFLSRTGQLPSNILLNHLYIHQNEAAIGHLMRVSAGLDSMVLGEPQILGQITDAYETALANETTGAVLSTLFRTAIHTGKQVRTETAIGKNAASISSVAAGLASQLLGDLSQQQILLIGTGEMGAIAVKALLKRGVTHLTVANRTYQKAVDLAQVWGGQATPIDQLPQALAQADIVISSTNALQSVLTQDIVAPVMAARPHRPLLIIDIAVPRDVSPGVGHLSNVHLQDIDDLQGQADENLQSRQAAIPQVEQIITERMTKFAQWLASTAAKSTIVDLRQQADQLRQSELERLFNKLDLSEKERNLVATMSHRFMNKLLHQPTLRLKQEVGNGNGQTYITAARQLFALDG